MFYRAYRHTTITKENSTQNLESTDRDIDQNKRRVATLLNVIQIGAGEPNIIIKFNCINSHFILYMCSDDSTKLFSITFIIISG